MAVFLMNIPPTQIKSMSGMPKPNRLLDRTQDRLWILRRNPALGDEKMELKGAEKTVLSKGDPVARLAPQRPQKRAFAGAVWPQRWHVVA
jgi:hypothetical protein